MALSSYDVLVGGSGMVHGVQLHPAVPDHALVHDDICRRIEKTTGTNNARMLFRRTPDDLVADVSVRLAASLGIKNTAKHSVGVGALLGPSVSPGDGNKLDLLASDGYHLMLLDTTTTRFELRLSRTLLDVSTTLWSKTTAGSLGVYRWFQFRLDVLRQLDGSAVLQVWENDLGHHQADAPVWVKVSDDIVEDPLDLPGFTGVGFGSQGFVGAGYPVYVDQFEVVA